MEDLWPALCFLLVLVLYFGASPRSLELSVRSIVSGFLKVVQLCKRILVVKWTRPDATGGTDHELEFDVPEKGRLNLLFEHCSKNPGHTNMVPVKELQLKHLPEGWRYPDILLAVLREAQLVAKITVSYMSPNRPEKYASVRGKRYNSVVTGYFLYDEEVLRSPNIPCPLPHCPIPGDHETTPIFKVRTANHVVLDNEEAKHTRLEFFYDSEEDKVVKAEVVDVSNSFSEHDNTCLLCVSHDLSLFRQLGTPRFDPSSIIADLPDNLPAWMVGVKARDPFVVIPSHPHGHFKHVSFGKWVDFIPRSCGGEDAGKSLNLQALLEYWKHLNPQCMESGISLPKGGFYSATKLKELQMFADANPQSTLQDWVARPSGPNLSFKHTGFMTYSTATCPGSSGAPVCLFVPGARLGKAWIGNFSGCHHRQFNDRLNANGNAVFFSEDMNAIEPFILERERVMSSGLKWMSQAAEAVHLSWKFLQSLFHRSRLRFVCLKREVPWLKSAVLYIFG